jgi:hypothetical protein
MPVSAGQRPKASVGTSLRLSSHTAPKVGKSPRLWPTSTNSTTISATLLTSHYQPVVVSWRDGIGGAVEHRASVSREPFGIARQQFVGGFVSHSPFTPGSLDVKPLIHAYIGARNGRAESARKRHIVRDFADREGYALGYIYEEARGDRTLCLGAAVRQSRADDSPALLVSNLNDLSRVPRAQEAILKRLLRELGPVLVAQTTEPDEVEESICVEVVTRAGRAEPIHFDLLASTVVIRRGRDHVAGVFDRAQLRGWLGAPQGLIRVAEVTFSLDHQVDTDGRVAISLPDVDAWTFSPECLLGLRRCI